MTGAAAELAEAERPGDDLRAIFKEDLLDDALDDVVDDINDESLEDIIKESIMDDEVLESTATIVPLNALLVTRVSWLGPESL